MRADLTAFAVDPLRAEPGELAEAPIAATVVTGSVVHRHAAWCGGPARPAGESAFAAETGPRRRPRPETSGR